MNEFDDFWNDYWDRDDDKAKAEARKETRDRKAQRKAAARKLNDVPHPEKLKVVIAASSPDDANCG